MRLDGGTTPAGTQDADFYLPRYFFRQFPTLVQFLDLYLKSLYEKNLTPDQVMHFLEDESWWENRDRNYPNEDARLLQKIIDLDKLRRDRFGLLGQTTNLLDDKSLQRKSQKLNVLDNLILVDSDGKTLEIQDSETLPIKQWLETKGFTEIAESPISDIGFDLINFIKFSRHLLSIRGTMRCAEIFLGAVYNAQVEIELPRNQLAIIDDNFTLDGDIRIRDDVLYDEFTYVINLIGGDFSTIGRKYFEMYERIFHPAGFRVVLRVYTTEEWLIVSGGYVDLPSEVREWEQYFNNDFLPTMLGVQEWLT